MSQSSHVHLCESARPTYQMYSRDTLSCSRTSATARRRARTARLRPPAGAGAGAPARADGRVPQQLAPVGAGVLHVRRGQQGLPAVLRLPVLVASPRGPAVAAVRALVRRALAVHGTEDRLGPDADA